MIKARTWELQIQDVPQAKLREWQRYRGWTIKFLTEFEHSGGLTTREISSRTGCKARTAATLLGRMYSGGLVEKMERWGWRISRDGLSLLSLNYVNTLSTQHQHSVNTLSTQEPTMTPPLCFHATTCHIKRNCKEKVFNMKNAIVCKYCVWDSPNPRSLPAVPQEMNTVVNSES